MILRAQADRLAGGGLVHRLIVDLHRVDLLREVAGVAFDVDRVAYPERPASLNRHHADLAEIVSDLADFCFRHDNALPLEPENADAGTGRMIEYSTCGISSVARWPRQVNHPNPAGLSTLYHRQ